MAKKHQYIVSSRKGQTAVHKKERRQINQNLNQQIIKYSKKKNKKKK